MRYNFTAKEERRRFIRYANALLRKQRTDVELLDRSGRTPKQNDYMHVLCRILALEAGETEYYAKQVYFKQFANPGIFQRTTKDAITGKITTTYRSSKELSIPEMRMAIRNFIIWAAQQGYKLPQATINDDGTVKFNSEEDKKAYHQAEVVTSKSESYL